MFIKKYKSSFVDSIQIIVHSIKLCNRFSFCSVFLKSKRNKPLNIDYVSRIFKKGDHVEGVRHEGEAGWGEERCRRREILEKHHGCVVERKRITILCEQLCDNLQKKEYPLFERNLHYCLSIAENAIELSQVINVISKGNIHSNNIRHVYIKLVGKSVKIFDNIPVRSISLILNSMIKLDYYHDEFIFSFFKNIKRIVDQSNNIDICILYHFYINTFEKYSCMTNQNGILLNLFLKRIEDSVSSFQMQGISSVLRCNKKLVKTKIGFSPSGETNTWVKSHSNADEYWVAHVTHFEMDELRRGKNREEEKKMHYDLATKENLEFIKKINLSLRDHFYLKITYGSIQQLCNILEDLEFFNLTDNNCYYDVLNLLKTPKILCRFKNIDYINILNIIKNRNNKYIDFLPIDHFSFLFDAIKDKDFSQFCCNDLGELMKILNYFKKIYNLKFCMNKSEFFLEKSNLNEILSTSTLVYLLHDFSSVIKSNPTLNSLTGKLLAEVMRREDFIQGSGESERNCSSMSGYSSVVNGSLSLNEYVVLVKSVDALIDKGMVTSTNLKKGNFFLSTPDVDSLQISQYEKYSHYILYKLLILGKIKYDDFFVFMHILKTALILSPQFSIKDIVLFLNGLHVCYFFVTKENYLIFENSLNFLSTLIISHWKFCREGTESTFLRKEIMLRLRSYSKREKQNDENFHVRMSKEFRQVQNILEENYAYVNNANKSACGGDVATSTGIFSIRSEILLSNERNDCAVERDSQGDRDISHDSDKCSSILNPGFTKMSSVDCCNILHYFQKINYINYDVTKIILKNVYGNVHFLRNHVILKMIHGFSMIKNVNKEFTSFTSVFKKLLFQFFSSHRDSINVENSLKVEETVKLFYVVTKLSVQNEWKNCLITKYILIRLENVLEGGNLSVSSVHILLNAFRNMYPYRYISLVDFSLRGISQMLQVEVENTSTVKKIEEGREQSWGNNYSSEREGKIFSLTFLRIFFSVFPLLINPTTSINNNVNKVYIPTSMKLFEILHERIKEDASLVRETIPIIVNFINLSFRYIPFLKKYLNLVLQIMDVKEVLSKDLFCIFLLNLKYFSNNFFSVDKCDVLDVSEKRELMNRIDAQLESLYKNYSNIYKGKLHPNERNEGLKEIMKRKEGPYDFSFNKREIVFLDTENDDEREIISREYNCVDIKNLYEKNDQRAWEKPVMSHVQNEEINTTKENNKRGKNALNEFEIILKKYAYCQNCKEDKIEIAKNVKLLAFDIKYVDLKKKIIFEFLSEDNYFKEPDNSCIELLPSTNLRLMLLRKFHFHILLMPFYEWDSCHGRLEKVKAIFQKLLNVTSDHDSHPVQAERAHIFSAIGRYQ
ncbi:RAP protein, putative [Plasmodium ovale curtisi]|uniref:RAP protein, putative n=1 Tax=Plasmodium ovale curtisi TaxID=864141 RepID=A0A1A8WTF5_PLAOA|nr:RAP protein, putative [Plasmodium ovale curtisi]